MEINLIKIYPDKLIKNFFIRKRSLENLNNKNVATQISRNGFFLILLIRNLVSGEMLVLIYVGWLFLLHTIIIN